MMRVVLADDHSLFREGIASLLENAGYEVAGQADGGQGAIDAVRKSQPGLVLLDLSLPDEGWREALEVIKAEFPETWVVILTVSDADEDLFAAIQAGADGYIQKGVNADEFLGMLAGLPRGEAAISRKTAARLMAGYKALADDEGKGTKLSSRHLEILDYMRQGLSNKSIATRLFISENTVKYHVRNIFNILDVQNRTEAVAVALREGWVQHGKGDETR